MLGGRKLSPLGFQWYPNVARVEHVQLVPSRVHNHEGEKYRLITKFPLIGSYRMPDRSF